VTQGDYAGLAAPLNGNVSITTYKGNLGDNNTGVSNPAGFANNYGDPSTAPTPTARGMFWRGTMTVSMANVVDGTSSTLLAGDVMAQDRAFLLAPFTSWADSNQAVAVSSIPMNWKYPVGTTASYDTSLGFRSNHSGGCNFAFVDGSVHFLKDSIAAQTYRAVSTRAGGEVVSSDAY